MSKATVLNGIRNYQGIYTDVVKQIKKIKDNQDLTDQAKATRIAKIENENAEVLAVAKRELNTIIGAYRDELTATRKAKTASGLNDAEKIALVCNGIKSGAYTATMIRDVVDAFGDNPIALASIRTELTKSGDTNYNNIAVEIPRDANMQFSRVIGGLDNITNALDAEKSISFALDHSGDDMASALYVSGDTFNSWYDYISDVAE